MSPTTTAVVVNAIAETYRVTISFEEKVNRFLDDVLEVRTDYQKMIEEWRNVNELTEKYISECHSKNELTILFLSMDGLIKTANDLLSKCRSSNFFTKVLPSTINDIEDNLEHIKEIQGDIKIKISDLTELNEVEGKLINLGF